MDVIAVPLIGNVRPWQAVFFIVGYTRCAARVQHLHGAGTGASRPTHAEPAHAGWSATYTGLLKFMKARPRFFVYHYLGFTFASAVITGGVAWYPVHVSRTFGWSCG